MLQISHFTAVISNTVHNYSNLREHKIELMKDITV